MKFNPKGETKETGLCTKSVYKIRSLLRKP